MLNKTVWLWMLRVPVALYIPAYLARLARLPFATTLALCALVCFAAVMVLALAIKLLHRWKWIAQLPWDDKPPMAITSVLVERARIVEQNKNSLLDNRVLVQRPVTVTWTMSEALRPTACIASSLR